MDMERPYTVCFLGQTGFGKSSLINELFGTRFSTDPLVACTKELYAATVLDGEKDQTAQTDQKDQTDRKGRLVTVYDTPGIGEFSDNSRYFRYYQYAVGQSDCVVLVVTLDRTDSTSQELLEDLKPCVEGRRVRFVIALNRIDSSGVGEAEAGSYRPWDAQADAPSLQARAKIAKRLATIHDNFDDEFLPFEIVPVCALRHYGLDALRMAIM